jgi:hypothetical protein
MQNPPPPPPREPERAAQPPPAPTPPPVYDGRPPQAGLPRPRPPRRRQPTAVLIAAAVTGGVGLLLLVAIVGIMLSQSSQPNHGDFPVARAGNPRSNPSTTETPAPGIVPGANEIASNPASPLSEHAIVLRHLTASHAGLKVNKWHPSRPHYAATIVRANGEKATVPSSSRSDAAALVYNMGYHDQAPARLESLHVTSTIVGVEYEFTENGRRQFAYSEFGIKGGKVVGSLAEKRSTRPEGIAIDDDDLDVPPGSRNEPYPLPTSTDPHRNAVEQYICGQHYPQHWRIIRWHDERPAYRATIANQAGLGTDIELLAISRQDAETYAKSKSTSPRFQMKVTQFEPVGLALRVEYEIYVGGAWNDNDTTFVFSEGKIDRRLTAQMGVGLREIWLIEQRAKRG